jgi:hypothetical protein
MLGIFVLSEKEASFRLALFYFFTLFIFLALWMVLN